MAGAGGGEKGRAFCAAFEEFRGDRHKVVGAGTGLDEVEEAERRQAVNAFAFFFRHVAGLGNIDFADFTGATTSRRVPVVPGMRLMMCVRLRVKRRFCQRF